MGSFLLLRLFSLRLSCMCSIYQLDGWSSQGQYECVRVYKCALPLQLRLTIAEALGLMSHLMAHDKLEEQLPKLLPSILSLYKKNPEHYIISKVQHFMTYCELTNLSSRTLCKRSFQHFISSLNIYYFLYICCVCGE